MGSSALPTRGVKTVLTIAGSDSGGGAGIQADLKVFFALGCHGASAVTAVTAQNTLGVTGIHEVPSEFVVAQIEAVASDLGFDAAKTGMLASADIVEAVATALEANSVANLVVDPVMVAKSGHRLLSADAVEALSRRMLPLATVVTPNLHEVSLLLGAPVRSLSEMHAAARAVHALGPAHVVVKGGHLEAEAIDVFFDGRRSVELGGPRYETEDTHGTGCALAAAIAARLALGDEPLEAVRFAKDFVAGAIEHSLRLGRGHGPVHPGWRLWPEA
jgi:hydroxymethylpyrimidine/phosphomethylpyrimidine kinase